MPEMRNAHIAGSAHKRFWCGRDMPPLARVALLLATALASAPAQSQARLDGIISDSSGAPVPNAVVTAKNASTGVVYTAKSSEAGIYTFPVLPPAAYQITCEA